MRVAMVGSGGVGGYFGGRLAASGVEVAFLARGAHLAALRERGLQILSPNGDLHLPRGAAADDPTSIGIVDVVLFAVKLYDTESAIRLLPPLVGPDTLVIPLQNGVDSVETLAHAVGASHVAGGTAYVAAVVAEPGVIRHTGMGTIVVGSPDGRRLPLLDRLVEACKAAGFGARVSDNITVDIWSKFAGLTALSGMTAVTRCPIGVIQQDPDLWQLMVAALTESTAVARARGVPLPAAALDNLVSAAAAIPPGTRSSMLEDLERGRPLELPWLSGTVVRLGEASGVGTPTHRLIVTLLKPHAHGAR
jgi:2-dehydropantoate 2-reductase